MTKYAANTEVSSNKSREDIEKELSRFGADGFLYGWQDDKALVMFRYNGKHLKYLLGLPDKNSREFTLTETGRIRKSQKAIEDAYEQEVKRKWRALFLTIKGSLVSVDEGIQTFEEAFIGKIVLPNGQTVQDVMIPQIEAAYQNGNMPPLLEM